MYLVAIAALLVLLVNNNANAKATPPEINNNNLNNNAHSFDVQWRSFADIAAAVKAPRPSVETSLGTVTYTRDAPVMQHEVLMGSDESNTVTSVLVYSSATSTASVSFTFDRGLSNMQLLATPTSFKMDRFSRNITNDKDDEDEEDDDDVATNNNNHNNTNNNSSEEKMAARRFRGASDFLSGRTQVRKYEGDGTVLGVRTNLPFIRNYRVVFGVGVNEYRAIGDNEEIMNTTCIRFTVEMNKYFERDFGLHLVYVGFAKSSKDLFRESSSRGKLADITPFFTDSFGQDNYDIGVYLTELRQDQRSGNGMGRLGGAYEQSNKGGCAIYRKSGFITHEAGHLFGPFHPHEGVNFEPGHGFTIMSYTAAVYNALNLGSMMASTRWLDNTRFIQDTDLFYPVENSNRAPQVNEARYKSEYHIGPSTAFRFTMDANDPDEGDELVYYSQQLNYNTSKNGGYDYLRNQQTSIYEMNLTGIPMFVTPDVTTNRTSYFQSFVAAGIYQFNKLLDKEALENHVNDSSRQKEGKISYDMFLTVIDKNEAKRNAYFEKFDPIVYEYTQKMIESNRMLKNNDEERKQKHKELDLEMKKKLAAIDAKPWVNRRGHIHIKVIAHKDYEPLTLTMEPKKHEYKAGESVKLKWTYDSRTIPDTDHVNIRLSQDSKGSYPYLLARNIPVTRKELDIKMPYVAVKDANFYDGKNYRNERLGLGFLMIEHVEGIVFAPSNNSNTFKGLEGNEGGFKITIPENEMNKNAKLYSLRPPGSAIISTSEQLEKSVDALRVYDLSKPTKSGLGTPVDSSVQYVLTDPNGTILKKYTTKPSATDLLTNYLNSTNRLAGYYKLAAVVGSVGDESSIIGKALMEMQMENIQFGKPFFTEPVEFKVFVPNATRPAIPQTYYFINVDSKSDAFVSKGREHYLAKTGIPIGSTGVNYRFKDEGDTEIVRMDPETNDNSGSSDDTNSGGSSGSGTNTNDDNNNNNNDDQDGGTNNGGGGSSSTTNDNNNGEESEAVIEVSHNCDDSTCSSCSQPVQYIADDKCHAVPDNNNNNLNNHNNKRYYKASACTGASNEDLVINLFSNRDCSDQGERMSLSKSCAAQTA